MSNYNILFANMTEQIIKFLVILLIGIAAFGVYWFQFRVPDDYAWNQEMTLTFDHNGKTSPDLFDIGKLAEFVTKGDLEQLQSLDLGKADYNQLFGRNFNLMHSAVISPNPEIVIAYLVLFSVKIDHQDQDGRTPLHHAIDENSSAAVTVLLENGADAEIKNNSGYSSARFCTQLLQSMPKYEACEILLNYLSESRE